MQSFLERNTHPLSREARAQAQGKKAQLFSVVFCIMLAAYVAIFLLPTLSDETVGEAPPHLKAGDPVQLAKKMTKKSVEKATAPEHQDNDDAVHWKKDATEKHETDGRKDGGSSHGADDDKDALGQDTAGESLSRRDSIRPDEPIPIQQLKPWGYNTERNIPRWKAIYESIARDQAGRVGKFSLIDYGADQGFFSISTSHFFPNAVVMGLELGGVGGEIWKKLDKVKKGVLQIQEEKLQELKAKNMLICQTKMEPKHFFSLQKQNLMSNYQLVLSVFHWFPLDTREEFEKAITVLFRNAEVTFIELPTIGDNSALIRQQVGYKRFAKWYDGRTDVQRIIEDACRNQNLNVKVRKIVSVKWVKWEREVFRVDLQNDRRKTGENAFRYNRVQFGCKQRQEIYGCNRTRTLFNKCPAF